MKTNSKMHHSDHNYRQKVHNLLRNAKPGQTFLLNKLVKPENTDTFIKHVKEWMLAWEWSDGFEFSHDYNKLRKTEPDFKTRKITK